MDSDKLFIKENVVRRPPVSLGWLAAAAALTAALLAVAALVDVALPEPLTRAAPPHRFIAEIAQEHLVNLTSIGPRVAGSYENEVLGVGVVVEAVKRIARAASPHVRVELDVQIASGAFSLSFLDGMNHVYQHVSSVVARVSAEGGAPRGRRRALLLNCHIDTVPDSPGASDDGAGCAVLLETMRALAAGAAPRHDAVFLFNAAEENVLQASHGFITQHKWAKSVRAFINIEACGAGGREVLFQAGPHDPWIVEMYAGAVPHPFASSLAQELFESGLIPADTDFRIFRDFGKLSGVDLAWSANGYVYHTALDTAARVPPAALQRTGDNVLALARGMLASESLESEVERSARQPVFFDVVGLLVLSARAPAALLAAALALALAALLVQRTAVAASRDLYLGEGRAAWCGWCGWWGWWGCAGAGAGVWLAAQLAGLGAAAGVALLLHALGSRLAFYARPWLLAPLYALPALAVAWTTAASLARRRLARLRGAGGWWAARALHQGGTLCCATTLACCALRGVRSGFLPWLWTALPAAAGCLGSVRGGRAAPAWWWAGGALLPVLQTWYLALGSLRMFVPVMGRAGAAHPVPPDVAMALLTAALVLGACSWLLPLVVAARPLTIKRIVVVFSCGCAGACALALGGGARAGYSEAAPQRLMVLHTRRTTHAAAAVIAQEHFYWMPQLDANAPHSVDPYAEEMAAARLVPASECARWPYCGMPYYLPVLGLAAASHRAPAAAPPASTLLAAVRARRLNATHAELLVRIAAGPAHVVLIVSPAAGARVAWTSALASPLAGVEPGPGAGRGGRLTYFFALHSARAPHAPLTLLLQREEAAAGGEAVSAGTQVSLAGHALFGPRQRSPELARLLRRLPAWTAPTGWSVDLHLYQL